MDVIRIGGGHRLTGSIPISGAKNAALPLMIAGLLTDGTLELVNVPDLTDIATLGRLLGELGADLSRTGGGQTLEISAADITSTTAPYELVSKMRASFWVIGPLLAREGRARVSLPGGCAIGTRPVDIFLSGLEALGAEIDLVDGYVNAAAPSGLSGAEISLSIPSVGATHTLMMAATLADGETVLSNAAQEPEIVDVADCLRAMGAQIEGDGTGTIRIRGVDRLGGTRHEVLPDRIETGTYAMATAMTGGDVELIGGRADLLDAVLPVLTAAGIEVSATNQGMRVARNGARTRSVSVETAPYPGFPTDLQAQFMALMTTAEGESEIRETIFENRFMHVQELARLGADIRLNGDTAHVHGVDGLKGAPVMATDLRASVCLVIAGLAAEGETEVSRVYHLDRGFERIEEKLGACGARIERHKASA